MKQLTQRKNIVFTLWFDNLFGCTNKCRFCSLSVPMVTKLSEDQKALQEFFSLRKDDIRLLKLMGQEPYDQKKLSSVIDYLLSVGFKGSTINLTSIGSSVYTELMDRIGYLTLSFSGFNPSYYGFNSKEHPYKKNITTLVREYPHKIDKINWIIGKFNLPTIDEDLEEFFQTFPEKNVKVAFLVQKGVTYTKADAVLFADKLKKMRATFERNGYQVFQKEYGFYDKDFLDEAYNLENMELTYCYDRKPEEKWYRCTWELTNPENALISGEKYIMGEYGNYCTKSCAGEKFGENPQNSNIFFYKLMLRLLGQFESSFLVTH